MSLRETAADVAALIPRYSWELMDEDQRDGLMQRVVLPRYMKTTRDGVQLGPVFWAKQIGASPSAIKNRVQRLQQSRKSVSGTGAQWTESKAPRSVKTAEKLVENLVEKASDEVIETVYYGLKKAIKTEPIARDKTEKTFTQKFSDAAFRVWKLHDELQDAVPSKAEAERLRVIAQATLGFCESLLRSLDDGQPLSIDDELQHMIEEAYQS